jgi:DNA modification methylase
LTTKRRANSLDGKTWARNSISVWSDIRKSKEELKLKHPALFPAQLVERIIGCFLPPDGRVVLDPFCGLGSSVVAAHNLGKVGIGLDINAEYVKAARARVRRWPVGENRARPAAARKAPRACRVIRANAADVLKHADRGSVDLVVTSPPYWDVLTRRRSADRKAVRNYGDSGDDLGRIGDYDEFLMALQRVFAQVLLALKPGAYCAVIVMDVRKRDRFYPLHSDLAAAMQAAGYLWDDLIIWDRRQEYNHFRPLGYPAVFRVNKAHEYVLIFQKPR